MTHPTPAAVSAATPIITLLEDAARLLDTAAANDRCYIETRERIREALRYIREVGEPVPEIFRAAADAFVAKHTVTEEAANACMISLGIHNPDGSLTEAYAGDEAPVHNTLTKEDAQWLMQRNNDLSGEVLELREQIKVLHAGLIDIRDIAGAAIVRPHS